MPDIELIDFLGIMAIIASVVIFTQIVKAVVCELIKWLIKPRRK